MKKISARAAALPLSAALKVDLQAKKLANEGRSIINFCVGEPDFPTPAIVCEAGKKAIENGYTRYTNASGLTSLKQAIAARVERDVALHYDVSEIAVTTGGKYAVYAAVCALTDPGDEVLLPAPYWTSYYHIITLAGAVPVVLRTNVENGWKITPEQLTTAATTRTKCLILNNPNNPSGAVYTQTELEALSQTVCALDLFVIADEIYDAFLFTDKPFVPLAALNEAMRERTVTVNGLSKAYAMTGWRIGYALGNRKIIAAISAILSHTTGCPNTIAQQAAITALNEVSPEPMRETFALRRAIITEGLSDIKGIRFTIPDGAFYLMLCVDAPLSARYPDGATFSLALLNSAGVATVPCEDYGVPDAVRLSFSIDEDSLREGIRRIRKFVTDQVNTL